MKTPSILLVALTVFAIPAAASAETALVEATITKAGKRTPIAALTLDVAPGGRATEAEASGADGAFEVAVWREPVKGPKPGAARLSFRIDVNRGRSGRFKLRSARAVKPGVRQVIGAFRQGGGELLEVAVTTSP